MEPLSEAALGVLRDKTIADYLLEHCCGTTAFSKLDHGQKLLDHITQQFKLAGLPVPQTYMKSVDNLAIRVNKLMADKKGDFKKEVDASCELVRYVTLNLIMKARTHSHTHAPTHPSTHERPQELDMNKAPLGPLGKKMTAIERNEWVQLQVDSFDAASREALTDRILMATRAKKKAKQDLKDAAAAGETGAAKPEKPRKKQKAAPAVGVTAGASFGVAVESTTVVR